MIFLIPIIPIIPLIITVIIILFGQSISRISKFGYSDHQT